MKHVAVGLLLLGLSPLLWSAPVIDGVISPGEGWYSLGQSPYENPAGNGAGNHLDEFFYYPDPDRQYLYLAFNTQNTTSRNVAYGIGLDVDKASGSGYYTGGNDAWQRKIDFRNLPALEWEFYWWWSGADGAITSFNACEWTGTSWNYFNYGTYAYSGDATSGLQALEYKVAFSDLGINPVPRAVMLVLWIAGGIDSSAVDVIPSDPSVWDNDPNEWADTDTLSADYAIAVLETPGTTTPRIQVTPQINGLRVRADHPVTVTVYRPDGQKVLSQKVTNFLDLRDLSRGVYLYRVENTPITGKVLVTR